MPDVRKNICFVPPDLHGIPYPYEDKNAYFKMVECVFIWITTILESRGKEMRYHSNLFNQFGMSFSKIAALDTVKQVSSPSKSLYLYTYEELYLEHPLENQLAAELMDKAHIIKLYTDFRQFPFAYIDEAAKYQTDFLLFFDGNRTTDSITTYAIKKAKEQSLRYVSIQPATLWIEDQENLLELGKDELQLYNLIIREIQNKYREKNERVKK